jgi:hypothetical protein
MQNPIIKIFSTLDLLAVIPFLHEEGINRSMQEGNRGSK